jgi:hypothetical protein
MSKFAKLKRHAQFLAKARGHALDKFSSVPAWAIEMGARSEARCYVCQSWIQVNTRPMPNEVAVFGSAISIDCFGSK